MLIERAQIVLLVSCTLAAIGQLLFRTGSQDARSLWDFANPFVIGGLFAYGVSTLMWIWALSRTPLVFVYPFTMLTFAMVYCGSIFLLHERFPRMGYLGLALIFAGLMVVLWSRTEA